MELVTYQPQFKIVANGKNITEAIKASFSELTIKDVSGDKADTLTIKLDGSKISQLPTKNAALQVSLGFNGKLYNQGTFYINSISDSGFPQTVVITATSVPLGGKELPISIQTQKTNSWDNLPLADLLNIVASRNNLNPIVNKELGAIVIPHLDQTSESDMALMNRLARQYGGVSKVVDENWMFLKVGEGKNASGSKTLPVYTIHKSSCSSYQYQSNSRTQASSVVAKWNNPETGETGIEKVGIGEPSFQIIFPYPNAEEARAAAQARAQSMNTKSDTFRVTTEATHQLVKAFSEGYIKPEGWRREISGREWCIKQIVKNFTSGNGLVVSFICESVSH